METKILLRMIFLEKWNPYGHAAGLGLAGFIQDLTPAAIASGAIALVTIIQRLVTIYLTIQNNKAEQKRLQEAHEIDIRNKNILLKLELTDKQLARLKEVEHGTTN